VAIAAAAAPADQRPALAGLLGSDVEGGDAAAQLIRTELSLIGQQIEALRGHALQWLRPAAAEVSE
jgi:hypothetical protein